jgi:hypothetical protein
MSENFSKAKIITGFALVGNRLLPKRMLENAEPLQVKAMISHQASIVHRSVFNACGGFDVDFKIRMDYDFWLRVLDHEPFVFMNEIVVKFAEGGASGRHLKRYFWEELQANKKNLGHFSVFNWHRVKFVLERYMRSAAARNIE